jgi:hypothetical protein
LRHAQPEVFATRDACSFFQQASGRQRIDQLILLAHHGGSQARTTQCRIRVSSSSLKSSEKFVRDAARTKVTMTAPRKKAWKFWHEMHSVRHEMHNLCDTGFLQWTYRAAETCNKPGFKKV